MTAPELSADERARVAAFDAAPQLAESAPMTRAMLALAEELDGEANRCSDIVARIALRDAADRIRTTLAAVLAADPEPRDAVIERMAAAMWEDERGSLTLDWAEIVESARVEYRRRSAVALDASRGGQR